MGKHLLKYYSSLLGNCPSQFEEIKSSRSLSTDGRTSFRDDSVAEIDTDTESQKSINNPYHSRPSKDVPSALSPSKSRKNFRSMSSASSLEDSRSLTYLHPPSAGSLGSGSEKSDILVEDSSLRNTVPEPRTPSVRSLHIPARSSSPRLHQMQLSLANALRRLLRHKVRTGYQRIEWKCVSYTR
jgi:hypothetical protein